MRARSVAEISNMLCVDCAQRTLAPTMTALTTPLRDLSLATDAGVYLLSKSELGYVDGAERKLLDIVNGAADRSSLSDELDNAGSDWVETYHLTRDRANAMRMLNIRPTDRVLEVGCGCGAVTRYLAEQAGVVDALEPQRARAAVAAARVAGTNARVFAGDLHSVPDVQAWDLVIVNGVLEYVGDGSSESQPYVEFLQACVQRIAPGGALIVAIENRIGAKYLAGAPEDHGGTPFQGIEGYAINAPARTFTRPVLEALLRESGLGQQKFLHAFPDYKTTRVLMSDDALTDPRTRELAWRAPRFPSPNTGMPRAYAASERQIWRSMLEAGVADTFGNSFFVVAARNVSEVDLRWPEQRLLSFSSSRRRSRFLTSTTVDDVAGQIHVSRERISHEESPSLGQIELRVSNDSLQSGCDAAVAVANDPTMLEPVLNWWLSELEDNAHNEANAIDFVPHNVIVDGSQLRAIDQEWHGPIDRDVHRARGIALFAGELAHLTSPERWPGCETVGDVAVHLGSLVGIEFTAALWRQLLDWEVAFQVSVTGLNPDVITSALEFDLQDRRLDEYELGRDRVQLPDRRLVEQLRDRIELEQQWHRDQANRAEAAEQRERDALSLVHSKEGQLAELRAELDAIHTSRMWKSAERLRALRPGRRN